MKPCIMCGEVKDVKKQPLRKLINSIIIKYQDIKYSSPWGRALVYNAWLRYKQTALYTERVKYFGRIEAKRMFSMSECRWFKYSNVIKTKS